MKVSRVLKKALILYSIIYWIGGTLALIEFNVSVFLVYFCYVGFGFFLASYPGFHENN